MDLERRERKLERRGRDVRKSRARKEERIEEDRRVEF